MWPVALHSHYTSPLLLHSAISLSEPVYRRSKIVLGGSDDTLPHELRCAVILSLLWVSSLALADAVASGSKGVSTPGRDTLPQ